MSSIGAMFAPNHQAVADELVRVCRPGGTIGFTAWTPEGQIGALFRAMTPFLRRRRRRAAAAAVGLARPTSTSSSAIASSGACASGATCRSPPSGTPRTTPSHFRDLYGPTIAARKAAAGAGREAEFDEALDQVARDWNRGDADDARFEQEYLLAVGTRV